jgi:hypothetical protein
VSDFLLNLARRSAGLAPAVQSRVEPNLESVTRAEGDDAEAVPFPSQAPQAAAEPVDPLHAPALAVPLAAAIVERPIALLSTPVVQREPAAAVAVTRPVPLVMPTAPVLTSQPEPLGAGAAPMLPLPMATFDPQVARDEPSPPDPVHVPERVVERHFESRVEHELTRVIEQPVLKSREIVRADVVRDEHQSRPPTVEPPMGLVMLAPRLEPASEPASPRLSPPAPRLAEPSQVIERTVQVRIGTIEIHGTDAPAPAVAPVPPPHPSSAQGFDAFTHLRSYAPWSW